LTICCWPYECGPEVLFETCVAMKFVDNDDDDDHFLCIHMNVYLKFSLNNAAAATDTEQHHHQQQQHHDQQQ